MEDSNNGLIVVNEIAKHISKLVPGVSVRMSFLKEIEKLMDYDFGVFDICNIRNEKITLTDPIVRTKYGNVIERRFLYDYDTKYAGMSYSRWIHNEKRTLILRDSDLVRDNIRKKTRYYNEYLHAYGFEHVLNCEFANNGYNVASLTLYRTEQKDDFSENDMYYMELLGPCIIHALKETIAIESKSKEKHFLDRFSLTKREKEVVDLVFESKSNREIGEKLFISENTVKKHLYNIFQKMNLSSREKLMSYLYTEHYREY